VERARERYFVRLMDNETTISDLKFIVNAIQFPLPWRGLGRGIVHPQNQAQKKGCPYGQPF